MNDLISRQAVKDWLLRWEGYIDKDMIARMQCRVIDIPSAQPERKKGEWIYKNDLKQYFCSECGYPSLTYDDTYIYGMDLPNYCEDCGTDMRGEKDE